MDLPELQRRFGKVVLRRRLAAQIGQEKLAHQAGLHRTYLSALERGKHLPNLAVVFRLAQVFEISISQLMTEVETEEKVQEEPPALPRGRPRKQKKKKKAVAKSSRAKK